MTSGPLKPSQYWVDKWEWYQNVPAWSDALKSYKNELPGAIGHWLTKETPSAQVVVCWNNPCQCCNNVNH